MIDVASPSPVLQMTFSSSSHLQLKHIQVCGYHEKLNRCQVAKPSLSPLLACENQRWRNSRLFFLLLCLLGSTFPSPVTASRLVNSRRTLTFWQPLFRRLLFVRVLRKPLRIFRQHGDCPPEVRQFTAGLCCPVLWSPGCPRRVQSVYGPAGVMLFWNQSDCGDWWLFHAVLEALTSCCHGRDPAVLLLFLCMDRVGILRSEGILGVEMEEFFTH